MDGINRLVTVSQMKANSAADTALVGAERSRALEELRLALGKLRKTLSPAAARLLDEWLALAAHAMESG